MNRYNTSYKTDAFPLRKDNSEVQQIATHVADGEPQTFKQSNKYIIISNI